jgi:hypothetical protein
MSTEPTVPPAAGHPPAPATAIGPKEIRIYSHSGLYYWWPVWFFGFFFSLWTLVEDSRMIIVPSRARISKDFQTHEVAVKLHVAGDNEKQFDDNVKHLRVWKESEQDDNNPNGAEPRIRVSTQVWMGPIYLIIIFLVVLITNVRLRGLWSLVTVISIVTLALALTVFDGWDWLLTKFGALHVHTNLAGYLFLAVALFAAWAAAVFFFDRRTYVAFSPGQVRVCEEIGGREKVYDTTGLTIEKHRSDWFRHIILGFGSGDLSIKTSGADRHEILMPNVAFIGFKIDAIETLIRERATTRL